MLILWLQQETCYLLPLRLLVVFVGAVSSRASSPTVRSFCTLVTEGVYAAPASYGNQPQNKLYSIWEWSVHLPGIYCYSVATGYFELSCETQFTCFFVSVCLKHIMNIPSDFYLIIMFPLNHPMAICKQIVCILKSFIAIPS